MGDPVLGLMGKGKGGAPVSSDPVLALMGGGNEAAPLQADPVLQLMTGGEGKGGASSVGSHVWETAKGAGRTLIDLISRPMYASAGAAEELLAPTGGGLTAVPGRVLSEVFSGLPGVEGQKRDFTQVMERAGVGELGKLSDILPIFNDTGEGPALQRGGWADITGRGVVGLAADIALDPTTYLTAGGAPARKFFTQSGPKFLSRRGQAALKTIVEDLSPAYRFAAASDDAVVKQKVFRQLDEAKRLRMEAEIAKDPKLLDSTGIKWFGNEIVSSNSLRGLTDKVKEVVLSVPGGERAAKVAAGFRDAMERTFDPFAEIVGLDPAARDAIRNEIRDFQNSMAATGTRDFSGWAPLRTEELRLAKKYGKGDDGIQALGRKFADWREKTGTPELTKDELALFERVGAMYDDIGKRLVQNGIITGEQWDKYYKTYLFHDYKNKELLSEVADAAKHYGLTAPSKFSAERQFETLADARRITKGVNEEGVRARARGLKNAVYPELIPEYGITRGLGTHIEKSNRELWQSKLFENLREKHGIEIGPYEAGRVYDIQTPMAISAKDKIFINGFLDKSKSVQDLIDSFEYKILPTDTKQTKLAKKNLADAWAEWKAVERTRPSPGESYGNQRVEVFNSRLNTARSILERAQAAAEKTTRENFDGWAAAAAEAKAVLPKLSPDGQKELVRQLVSMTRSSSQAFRVREMVGEKLMPNIKALREGDIEPFFTKYGLPEDKARLIKVSGGLWGEKEHLVPQAVATLVEEMPHDMVKSAFAKAHLGGMVDLYDKYNNLFKGLTYPFWPAGAVRDTYNNLQHSFLGLGIGGLARPGLAMDITRSDWKRLGSDASKLVKIGDHKFTLGQWKKITEDLRVIDPSASSFVQFTGEQGPQKASLYAKARTARGNVDNATRTQLFINGVAQGMSLEDAARLVHDFHYNYNELSKFDRDVLRRIFPFIVFTRKSVGLYGEQVFKQPGRVVNLAKPFMGRDDENQAMTTWEGEGFKLRLDRDGKNVTMLNGIDLPVRSLDMLWRGAPGKTLEGLIASASPAIKVPYEFAADRDPFRGKPFGRSDRPTLGRAMEHMPKWAQDFVGFKKEQDQAGRTRYMMRDDRVQPLVEAAMVSRFFSTPDRVFREQLREPNAAARWLDFLTGLRFKTLNLDEEQKAKVAAAIRAAQEEDVKQGLKREYRTIYTPKAGRGNP